MDLYWDSYANLFSHKSMKILVKDEDTRLTRFSAISVKSVLRNYIDLLSDLKEQDKNALLSQWRASLMSNIEMVVKKQCLTK